MKKDEREIQKLDDTRMSWSMLGVERGQVSGTASQSELIWEPDSGRQVTFTRVRGGFQVEEAE